MCRSFSFSITSAQILLAIFQLLLFWFDPYLTWPSLCSLFFTHRFLVKYYLNEYFSIPVTPFLSVTWCIIFTEAIRFGDNNLQFHVAIGLHHNSIVQLRICLVFRWKHFLWEFLPRSSIFMPLLAAPTRSHTGPLEILNNFRRVRSGNCNSHR